MGEIADLEFENHGFLKNHVFLPTEQAGTNICSMVYQDINFKICLSLFGWKENILPNVHIVQCCKSLTLTLLRRKAEGEAKPEKEWRPTSLSQMALVAHTIILGIQVRSTP